jgi:glycosyltransferase involved in cell wall biosynthesis
MEQQHRRAGFRFASTEVIWGGVPVKTFLSDRARTPAKEGPLRLLYAGQLSPDRGLLTIVEAIGGMEPAVRENLRLDVAGTGPADYATRVQARVEELRLEPLVRFLGRVEHPNMAEIFRSHDVLVFASRRAEGMPLTMVEAMLSGCAVVTTRAGGAGEIADLAELPCFPPEDPAALRNLLSSLASDRERIAELGDRGRRIALERLSLDQTVGRYLSRLESLVSRPSPALQPGS